MQDRNELALLDDMLKLGMDAPMGICENWKRDLTSFVELSAGPSTTELDDIGLGTEGKHGLFTFALMKKEEARHMKVLFSFLAACVACRCQWPME